MAPPRAISLCPTATFCPPMKMTCGEVSLARAGEETLRAHTVTIGRTAILTKNHNGRAACHYCGPCERGCQTYSYFSSPFTTVKDAIKTGKCTLIPNAVVAHVDLASSHRQGGWRDLRRPRHRGKTKKVRAKSVILCAQALESTRILLNSSTSARIEQGSWKFQRAAGPRADGSRAGAGARGELPGYETRALRQAVPTSRQWHLRHPLS